MTSSNLVALFVSPLQTVTHIPPCLTTSLNMLESLCLLVLLFWWKLSPLKTIDPVKSAVNSLAKHNSPLQIVSGERAPG
jgi:hypothetical protein